MSQKNTAPKKGDDSLRDLKLDIHFFEGVIRKYLWNHFIGELPQNSKGVPRSPEEFEILTVLAQRILQKTALFSTIYGENPRQADAFQHRIRNGIQAAYRTCGMVKRGARYSHGELMMVCESVLRLVDLLDSFQFGISNGTKGGSLDPGPEQVDEILKSLGVDRNTFKPYDWKIFVEREITGDDLKTAKSNKWIFAQKGTKRKNLYNVASVVERWFDRFKGETP